MNPEDVMIVTDRLDKAADTLRKVNLSRLSVLDRVNVSSAIVDITDTIAYVKTLALQIPHSGWGPR